MRDLQLAEALDRILTISEPRSSLTDDAPCITLVVAAVRALLLRADERFQRVLDRGTGHSSSPEPWSERPEAVFSLKFIESLWQKAR